MYSRCPQTARPLPSPASGREQGFGARVLRLGWLPISVPALLLSISSAQADSPSLNSALPIAEVFSLVRNQAAIPAGARLEVEAGSLDPRLRLAPCNHIQAYLPAGVRPWGRTRVGLRCTDGPVAWNVYLPVTVRVWGQAVVTASAVPADTPLSAADLRLGEVDLAEQPSPACTSMAELIGRRIARALPPGATLRADSLRARLWFAAGDSVSVTTQGTGFSISSEARAMSPGLEGQPTRLRTESGRILTAWPVGERRAEVRM
jgi:flagellar basal body P-ring formation protein FlgA